MTQINETSLIKRCILLTKLLSLKSLLMTYEYNTFQDFSQTFGISFSSRTFSGLKITISELHDSSRFSMTVWTLNIDTDIRTTWGVERAPEVSSWPQSPGQPSPYRPPAAGRWRPPPAWPSRWASPHWRGLAPRRWPPRTGCWSPLPPDGPGKEKQRWETLQTA